MHTLAQDIRYGFRILRKSHVVTLVAVLSLALGIGGNSTMFSVIHTLLLQPPPYKDVDRLAVIFGSSVSKGRGRTAIAGADLLDWRKQSRSFEYLELTDGSSDVQTLSVSGPPERIRSSYVSPDLFRALGVKPVLGRSFSDTETRAGVQTVMLSYEFWQRRFGSDPGALGRSLVYQGNPVTIIGVMPLGSAIFGGNVDIWEPANLAQGAMNRKIPWLIGIGRLKASVTLAQAQAELSGIARQLEQAYPDTNKDRGVLIDPLQLALTAGLKEDLYPLSGAVGFVLLIACANVANLLLARAGARKREIVVRVALGAGRARIVRQLLTESVILATVGGFLGWSVAFWGIKLFQALAPEWFPNVQQIALNLPVAGFTFGVSVATGILVGLVPAMQASRPDLNESLKASRGSGRSQGRTRAALVMGEVALALVLMVGAGLMVNSLIRVSHTSPGFDPAKLVTLQIDLSGLRYTRAIEQGDTTNTISPEVEPFYDRVLERVRSLPGVESAALASWLPQGQGAAGPRERRFVIAGRPELSTQEQPQAFYNMVSPDYFLTLHIPVIRGRFLTNRDTQNAPWVVVVNEVMARQFWPNQDPIGQLVTIKTIKEERPREVVGVVGNVRQIWRGGRFNPEFYAPFQQQPPVYGDGWQNRLHRFVVARTTLKPDSVMAVARAEALALDRDQPVSDLHTMDEFLSASAAPWRFYLALLGTFAGISLFLAAIGIYGVISHSIGERTHEIGIRMAIGAARGDVLRLVFRHGLTLTIVGLIIGLAASFALTRVIAGFLYGVKATDPLTLATATVLLAAIACAAILQPARRASRVDPSVALRHQ